MLKPSNAIITSNQEAEGHWPAAQATSSAVFHAIFNCHLLESQAITAVPSPPNPPYSASSPSFDDIFFSEADLRQSAWLPYFASVYGLSTLIYPLHVTSLRYLYRARLPAALVQQLSSMIAPQKVRRLFRPPAYLQSTCCRWYAGDVARPACRLPLRKCDACALSDGIWRPLALVSSPQWGMYLPG